MTKPPPTYPVAGIVADAKSLLVHVWEGSERVRRNPADVFSALATVVLLYHLKDWAMMDEKFRTHCPFSQTIAEVANGAKHFRIDNIHWTTDPHVTAVVRRPPMPPATLNSAPLNTQPLNSPGHPGSIRLTTRRFAGDAEATFTAWEVIHEAFEWWRGELG